MNYVTNIVNHDQRKRQKIWINRIVSYLLGMLTMLFLFTLFGCVPSATQRAQDPVVVDLRIMGVDTVKVDANEDKVTRTMEVENQQGELSGMTFIEGNTGYMKIWGGLSSADAIFIWNDLCLLGLRGVKTVELYINSGGGSAFDGISIADQIEKFVKNGGIVNAHATGIIASATVPIFAVCSKRYASTGTVFMVHKGKLFKFVVEETKDDLISQKEMMDILEDNYYGKLSKNTKLSIVDWRKHANSTTWFSVEQAIEWGLVDEVE